MARALRCGILGLAFLAVAGCAPSGTTGAASSPSAPASASPTSIPNIGTTPTPAAAGQCPVSQLSLSAGPHNAGAGTVQQAFVFTNTGQSTCQLDGYPGMQMLNGGQQIPTKVVRMAGSAQTVSVAPGGTASFLARWHDQTGYTTPCATSQQVQVTPPNASSQLTVTATIQACPDGTIDVTPVTAGSTGGQ